MSGPPPANLMDWPKAELAKEVARLRAVLHEHSNQPADDPTSGGGLVDIAGDPFARGGVVIDTRKAVLLDKLDVTLIDPKRPRDPPAMAMLMQGRVNMTTSRTRQLYLFGPDGAAGLVTELVTLAARAGGDFEARFKESFDQRMDDMPKPPGG
jgi:hypothetical protein